MKRLSGRRVIVGAAVLVAVAALVLAVFSLLSVTDKADVYFADTQARQNGWDYEVLDGSGLHGYEPVFSNGYMLSLPEDTKAVRITRTMTEVVSMPELEWVCVEDGVEVFLDGDVLHSDFPGLARDKDGFVHPDGEQWARLARGVRDGMRNTQVSLPEDYTGKELTVVTYFPEGHVGTPEYPILRGEGTDMAEIIVISVRYDAAMTIYALLAILMALVFLADTYNRNGDGRTLLLSLYFLMMFLQGAYGSEAGYYSVLTSRLDLRFLDGVFMAPLYLYLALRLKSRWKWALCGVIGVWVVHAIAQELLVMYNTPEGIAGSIGPETLAVLVLVAVALCVDGVCQGRNGRTRQEKRRLLICGLIGVCIAAGNQLERVQALGGLKEYLVDGIWQGLRMGNCWPIVGIGTDIISYATVIVVLSETVRRTLRTHRTVDVLRERERQTMAGYKRLLASEDATRALHHEMRHHMLALSAILADGDAERAHRYVDAVADDLAQVPAGRYCQNILVDMIAGSFLDQAASEGIRVEHHLNVPQTMNIADEDLSVFLSNMLQNALEACRRMDPKEDRYIWVDMHLRGNFLCVQCVNSAPDESDANDTRERQGHGYGLVAMRAVAEKYNSVLLLERTPGRFSATSDFCLERI